MTARRIAAPVAGLAATLALGLLAGACGDGSPTADGPDRTATSSPATTVHHGHVVDVHAVDFAFRGLPRRVTAGTRLTLANDAPSELHELVAFRLPDGEDRTVEELLGQPPEELRALLSAGPPATVLLAPPGGEQVAAVGDGTLREPGRYLVVCSIPTGVDPATYLAAAASSGGGPPDVPGGPPHLAHGMATDLVVEPAQS